MSMVSNIIVHNFLLIITIKLNVIENLLPNNLFTKIVFQLITIHLIIIYG